MNAAPSWNKKLTELVDQAVGLEREAHSKRCEYNDAFDAFVKRTGCSKKELRRLERKMEAAADEQDDAEEKAEQAVKAANAEARRQGLEINWMDRLF